MDLAHVRALVAEGETESIELKKSTGQRQRAAATVCGMLNAGGGIVIFGVTPDSRRIVGQDIAERTLEQVHAELRKIVPFVSISPEVVRLPDTDRVLIVLSVPGGNGGPYSYDGRAYARNGSETVEMPRELYERLLYERMHPTRRWELQSATGLTLDDLDRDEVARTVQEAVRRGRLSEPGTRDTEEVLRKLKVVDKDGQLLNAAVALFGVGETFLPHYPQCMLRLAHFRGTTTDRFEDNRQIRGNAFALLDEAERFMRSRLPISGRIVPDLFERVDDPLYPVEALREAVANALCHRDYSGGGGSVSIGIFDDRLEVTSAGRLPFGQSVDDLIRVHTSQPWNPLMANVFYMRGIIDQWGRGTLKIIDLTRRAELRTATFESDAHSVTVRFYAQRNLSFERMSPVQQSTLGVLRDEGAALSLSEIVEKVNDGAADRTIQKALQELRDLGYVELRGRGRGARWLARSLS